MPYKRVGKVIYSKSGGKWHVKQRCKSVANAVKAMQLLQMLEHHEGTEVDDQARAAALRSSMEKGMRK